MNAVIRATCRCGDVELTPEDITLVDRGDSMVYGFVCTACDRIVCYPANPRTESVLLACHVTVRRVVPDFAAEVGIAIALLVNVKDVGDLTDERGCW